MKVSYNWLKTYLDFNYTPEELSAILTQTGLEVESLETYLEIQGGLAGVVTGEVLTCEQHPDADKLKVTTVNIGKADPLQIVCGAPNVAAGQKVLVATVGCTLYPQPDQPFEIKKAKIRGVASEGMLCAEDELGLGNSHDGILVLPASTAVGQKAATYFELTADTQLEIGLTPNRADAMGHIGVARDILAYHNLHADTKIQLQFPEVPALKNENLNPLEIQIDDTEGCKKYHGLILNNVKVGPSPKWLQNRLKAVGLKPINNVVDISNFVQRELGTPLHIFDADQIEQPIKIRCAQANESFIGLDQTTYKLAGHELVIADSKGAQCLAGVLGGNKSGVSENTTRVLIESALFDAVRIRKAARQHGLNTDASFRFERGVDPALTNYALLRCANLLQELTGAQIGSATFKYEGQLPKAIKLDLSLNAINQLIGNDISKPAIQQILDDLDFQTLSFQNDTWELIVPSYRVDVTRPVDVIEEIIRIYGLNNIALPEKWNFSLAKVHAIDTEIQKSNAAEFFVGRGYFEALNNSLTKKQYAQFLDESYGQAISILNPLSQDLANLRQTLLFGLLENLQHNQNRQIANIQLFEFGQSYQLHAQTRIEKQELAMVLFGKQQTENWNSQGLSHTYFSLKKEVYALLERFGIAALCNENQNKSSIYHQGTDICIENELVVSYGQIVGQIQNAFDLKQEVFYAQFNWTLLNQIAAQQQIKFKEVPKSFAVRRDLSLLVDQSLNYSDLVASARKAETKLLQDIQLFDVYEGKNLPENKKSYALAFYLQDKQQTLGEQQIEKAMQRILNALQKDCQVELRK